MRITKEYVKNLIIAVFVTALVICFPLTVQAAELSVQLGADRYDKNSDTQFQVSTYLKSDVGISAYTIVLEYDRSRLEVTGGYDDIDISNGTVTVSGSGEYLTNIKVWIDFKTTSGGDAYIKVLSANAVGADGTEYDIETLDEATVRIKGEDISEQNLADLEASIENVIGAASDDDTSDDANEDISEPVGDDSLQEQENLAEGNNVSDPAQTGTDDGASSINKKAVIYWVAVVALIAVLVSIPLITTFGKKKKEAVGEELAEEDIVVETIEDESEVAVDEATEGIIEEVAEEAAEESTEEVVEEDTEEVAGESTGESVEEASEETVEEKSEEEIIEPTIEETSEQTSEETTEEPKVMMETSEEITSDEPEDVPEEASEEESPEEVATEEVASAEELCEEVDKLAPIFTAENVTVRGRIRPKASKNRNNADYKVIDVIEGMDIKIYPGEVIEITGTSSREQEAFIGLLVGKCNPAVGTVTKSPMRFRMVAAKSSFEAGYTVKENIYRHGALMGHPKTVLDNSMSRILKFAVADKYADEKAMDVPSDVLKKTEIALSLLDDRTDILILNNVFSECDEKFISKCNIIIGKMAAKNITVLLFGSVPKEISESCTRNIRIINGHVC